MIITLDLTIKLLDRKGEPLTEGENNDEVLFGDVLATAVEFADPNGKPESKDLKKRKDVSKEMAAAGDSYQLDGNTLKEIVAWCEFRHGRGDLRVMNELYRVFEDAEAVAEASKAEAANKDKAAE